MSEAAIDWTDPSTYASTASTLGTSLGALATGINGFAQAVASPGGVIQPTPQVAGLPAQDATAQEPPTFWQSAAQKMGVPIAAAIAIVLLVPVLILGVVWKLLK